MESVTHKLQELYIKDVTEVAKPAGAAAATGTPGAGVATAGAGRLGA